MAGASNINQSSKTCCSFFSEIKCKKEHVIAAVVGSALITLGVILKFYPGVNSVVMASLIAGGAVILIVDLFLARAEDKPKPKIAKSFLESGVLDDVETPPSLQKVVKNVKPQDDPAQLLALALDEGSMADLHKLINEKFDLNASYDNQEPLERALNNYYRKKTGVNYLKIVVLYEAGAKCKINGLSPFAFVCKKLISSIKGDKIVCSKQDQDLLLMFRPKEDLGIQMEIDKLKTDFAGPQHRLLNEKLFDFVRLLKREQ